MLVDKERQIQLIKKVVAMCGNQTNMAQKISEQIGCAQSQTKISKWVRGESSPNLQSLIAIQLITKNKIKVGHFVPGLKYSKPQETQ